jgi:uncharacterized protein YgbK (DUF1537 family)
MAAVPRLIIVADDLTGAMDAAGPLADRGLCTWAVAGFDAGMPRDLAGAEVVSINADSRHLHAAEAAQRVRAILRGLLHSDCEILVKKIDSTLRGNVVAETLALLDESGRKTAVVAPAFPRQGRTLKGGVVHVRGVPLKDTNLARDALAPPPLEPLHVLFARAQAHIDVRLIRPEELVAPMRNDRRQLVVVDGASDEDLRATVRAWQGQLRDTLLVGSAGISEAIAQVCFERAPDELPAPAVRGPLLFVVGSRAEQSAEQAAALIEAGLAQMVAAPSGHIDIAAAMHATTVALVLKSTAGGDGVPSEVAHSLAEGVAVLLERLPIAAVVATGGDTAIAILQRLSRPALRVMGNLLPGIPFSRIHAGGRDVWFVTKAGAFGSADTFVAIARRLRGIA